MPDFTISVTGPQASRVAKAFGHAIIGEDMKQTWQNATSQEVLDAIKTFLKTRVQSYEASQAAQTVQETVQAETW